MVLYFTRCAPLFHIKLTQMLLILMPIDKGCITESEQQRYGLKICENELVLLGVFIGKNQSQYATN
jgi:hypothetical protein